MSDYLKFIVIWLLVIVGTMFAINELRVLKDSPQSINYNGYLPLQLENEMLYYNQNTGGAVYVYYDFGYYYIEIDIQNLPIGFSWQFIWYIVDESYYNVYQPQMGYVEISNYGASVVINGFKYSYSSDSYLYIHVWGYSNFEVQS